VQYLITPGHDLEQHRRRRLRRERPGRRQRHETGKAQNRRIEVILMPLLGDIPELKAMLTGGKS
jgi:hypothetical protein